MEGNNNENENELISDMMEEVLFRMDVPEVTAFKAVGVWYRDLIGSEGFSARYNRYRRPNCNWLVTRVLTPDNPRAGFLYWARPLDGRRLIIDLRPYLATHHLLMNDDYEEINLHCASGSILVFQLISKNDDVFLVTINVFTNQVVFLPVPPYLYFDYLFDLKTLKHPDAFDILYTQMVNDHVPHYCQFSSQNQNWELLLDALPALANHHHLNPSDPRRMIMAFHAFTFFVSFKNHADQQPYFIPQPTMHLMRLHPFLNLQVVDGWQPLLTHHYGRSGTGLAVSLLRYSHPLHPPNAYFISQLLLHRIDPTFDHYQLISILPDGFPPHADIVPMTDFSLEETDDGVILFSMIAGFPGLALNLLVYTYHNGVWGYSYTPVPDHAHRASPPVSISQLTI